MILADRLSRFPSRSENLLIELHHNIPHVTFTHNEINIIRGATERIPFSTQFTTPCKMDGQTDSMKFPAQHTSFGVLGMN